MRLKEETVVSKGYDSLKRIEERLYEISYDAIDYASAGKAFADGKAEINASGCSSVRNGNYYGRNLDWFFDDCVEVIVHTRASKDRLATLGVVGAVSAISKTAVDNGSIRNMLDIIPFFVVDGVNEKGVFINVNVAPAADLKTPNTQIMPTGEVRETINSGMLVRFVLDRFSSAEEAVRYLQQHVSIKLNENLTKFHFETHWMLGDELQTYILEMLDDRLVVQCADKNSGTNIAGRPIMTNFYLNTPGVTFGKDGKVATNHDGQPNQSGITPHGIGLERYNLAVEEYRGADSFLGMRKLMSDLYCSRAYNIYMDEPWYSEFAEGELTNSSPIEDYGVEKRLKKYSNRSRADGTNGIWVTTHTSIYDIANRQLYIIVAEEMTGYRIPFAGE